MKVSPTDGDVKKIKANYLLPPRIVEIVLLRRVQRLLGASLHLRAQPDSLRRLGSVVAEIVIIWLLRLAKTFGFVVLPVRLLTTGATVSLDLVVKEGQNGETN